VVEFIHWVPRLWAHGTAGLNGDQRAVYMEVINHTYLLGAAPREDVGALAALMQWRPSKVKRVLEQLVDAGKIERANGYLVANHCLAELERAESRVENARSARNSRRKKTARSNCEPFVSVRNLDVSVRNLDVTWTYLFRSRTYLTPRLMKINHLALRWPLIREIREKTPLAPCGAGVRGA